MSVFRLVRTSAVLCMPAWLLLGCAAIKYEPQYLDSPTPDLAAAPLCKRAGGHLMRLPIGQQCMALVRSADWLTRVPVAVDAGETYEISVQRDQFWYDATERIAAPRGVGGHGIKNIAEGWKRHPESGWFALIVTTVAPEGNGDHELEWHDAGQYRTMTMQRSGQLAMYPNDARGLPLMRRMFYDNNHGQIWVRVGHIDAGSGGAGPASAR